MNKKLLQIFTLALGLGLGLSHAQVAVGSDLPRFSAQSLNQQGKVNLRMWQDSGYTTLVTFGATWCVPCLAEQKTIDSLLSKHPNLRAVAVLTDATLDSKVQNYAKKANVRFPIIHDFAGILAKRYQVGAELPQVFLANSAGQIKWMHIGFDASKQHLWAAELLNSL